MNAHETLADDGDNRAGADRADSKARVHSIQVGRIGTLGPDLTPSAFVKTRVVGPARIERLGLLGDEQADLRVHGGPNKAVYAYPLSAYEAWRRDFPHYAGLLAPGGLGENLTIAGLDEASVCLDDIVRMGEAVLQVSQPRQPCFKLGLRFEDPRMPRAMMKNGRCGWYFRVIAPGLVDDGDAIILEARPKPLWSIARLHRLLASGEASPEERDELESFEGLRDYWPQRSN